MLLQRSWPLVSMTELYDEYSFKMVLCHAGFSPVDLESLLCSLCNDDLVGLTVDHDLPVA